MREYVLNEALTRQAIGPRAVLVRIVRNWKHRNELRRLLSAEDYILADIGLSRPLLQHLLNQSLLVDLDWERERVLRQR